MNDISELGKILQNSVSPVVLISGIGLLILSITNRYGRTIDRARVLKKEIIHASATEKEIIIKEINVLYRRSRILLYSISAAVVSVLLVCILIVTLFIGYFFHLDLFILGTVCFVLSLLSLITSTLLFIRDMTISLQAVKLDIEQYIQK